jgi:hypothetical protein
MPDGSSQVRNVGGPLVRALALADTTGHQVSLDRPQTERASAVSLDLGIGCASAHLE